MHNDKSNNNNLLNDDNGLTISIFKPPTELLCIMGNGRKRDARMRIPVRGCPH